MKSISNKDTRVRAIITQLAKYTSGDYDYFSPVSPNIDETDAIIASLNQLGDQLSNNEQDRLSKEHRINELLEVVMEYTSMDFSRKARISGKGDEIDALSAGLNSLAEELKNLQRQLMAFNK